MQILHGMSVDVPLLTPVGYNFKGGHYLITVGYSSCLHRKHNPSPAHPIFPISLKERSLEDL